MLLLVYAAPAEADLSDELEEAPQQQVAPLHRPRKADDGRDWGEATPHSPLGKSQHDKPSLNPSQESSPAPKPGVAAAASSKSTPASRKGGEAPRLSGGKDNASRQLPVTFEGDGLSGARQEGTLTLHAHVKVAQGDFQMFADHAQVFFDPISDEVQKVVAKGRVRMTKIDPQTGQKVRAKSQVVEFEAASQQVLLTGNAELQRDKDTTIRGEFIKYDMASGLINAGRVKGVVQPGKKHE